VENGSLTRKPGSMEVNFILTDYAQTVPVSYTGVLPDLFREGQGVIARGRMDGNRFVAEEVLAKHDENYMPPEVADSLKPHMDAANSADAAPATAAATPVPGST
jgi:cytochrome c-type biogenesis protein CcmE